jgi:D-arabinose 1-dehydrogenase-like Zn-dependent alcohol dehydrogenase
LLNHEPVAVVGLGVLGLLIAAELVDMGIEVVGYDIYATGPKREAFEMLGPMATFVESEPNSINENAGRFPLVIEIAGGQRSLVDSVNLVEMGGTVLAVGIPMCEDVVSGHQDIVVKGATVKGIVSADRLDYMQAVSALRLWFHTRPEFLDKLVTHRIRYEDFEQALAIDPKDRIKVALAFN